MLFLLAAVAAAAALSAVTFPSGQSRASSRAAQASRGAAQPPGAQGAVVVRDAVSGQLREPTPQELIELLGQAQIPSVPEPIVSSQGFDGLRLGDEQMNYTVATRKADGSIDVAHAAGKREADQLVKSGALAAKEQLHER